MRNKIQSFLLSALPWGVMASENAIGATLIEPFDNFNLSGMYESWDTFGVTTIVSGPTSFDVTSRGFGGGFFDLNPQIDASGETEISLEVAVDAASSLPGVVLALVDGDGTLQNYRWLGLADGNHTLTKTIGMTAFGGEAGTIPGMDLSTLDFFHIQVDGAAPYTVSFKNLELTGIPEPASAMLLATVLAGCLGVWRPDRRKGMTS